MLDRTGNTDGDVQLGRNDFAGLTVLHTATAGNDDLGSGQFRPIGLGQFFPDEAGNFRVVSSRHRFDSRRTTFTSHRVKTGGTHGDDLDRCVGLYGGNGVTSVDRALEGVSAFNRDDLGYLVDVQLRSNARLDVLAVGRSRGQDMAVNCVLFEHQASH